MINIGSNFIEHGKHANKEFISGFFTVLSAYRFYLMPYFSGP